MKIKFLSSFFLAVFALSTSFANDIHIVNTLNSGQIPLNTPQTFSSGESCDLLEDSSSYFAFGVNGDIIPFATNYTFGFTARMNVSITPYDINGLQQATENREIEIVYNPSLGAGNLKDLFKLELKNTLGYDYQITGLTFIDANGDPSTELPNNIYISLEYNSNCYKALNEDTSYSLSHQLDASTNTLDISWLSVAGAEEYELEWSWIDNYGPYDFQNDQAQLLQAGEVALTEQTFKHNSSRIAIDHEYNTTNYSYHIPLTYSKGFLIYRLRAVGKFMNDLDKNYYAKWSSGTNTKEFVSDWNYPTHVFEITTEFEDVKNWQTQTSYAEGGKNKQVVSFFDGTLRNRQTVTKINTDNNIIVGEVIYDTQGRPAVEVLPTPTTTNNGIVYYPDVSVSDDFTNSTSQPVPYTHRDFDWEQTNQTDCGTETNAMHNEFGSSKYYATNGLNDNDEEWQKYVADAKKYPFSQIEYTPDNTGRIKRKSGVGQTHQLNTGHEMKYYYGKPFQPELNRLFGYHVGVASHYKKNVVSDPNGQKSVSYIDPQGRTIATALVDDSPANLLSDDVIDAQTTLNIDLLNKLNEDDADTDQDDNVKFSSGDFGTLYDGLVVESNIIVTKEGTVYDFNYVLEQQSFEYNFSEGDCSVTFNDIVFYDISLKVLNECGDEVFSFEDINQNVSQPFQLTLTEGEYRIYKILKINRERFQTSWESFLLSLVVDETTNTYCFSDDIVSNLLVENNCDGSICDLLNEGNLLSGFTAEINTYYENLGFDVASYSGTTIAIIESNTSGLETILIEEIEQIINVYNQTYADIVATCDISRDTCNINELFLLNDVSPDGQYGLTDVNDAGEIEDRLSVFNINNEIYYNGEINGGSNDFHWKNQSLQYVEEDGTESKIEVFNGEVGQTTGWEPAVDVVPEESNDRYFVRPNELTNVSDFIDNWKDNWAKTLVIYHPEHEYYQYELASMCTLETGETYTSSEFNEVLNALHTYADAEAEFGSLEDATDVKNNLLNKDAYFNHNILDQNYSVERKNIMIHAIDTNYDGTDMSMVQYALSVAYCSNLNPDCGAQFSSLNPAQKNMYWNSLKNYYLGLKNRIFDVYSNFYAITKGHYNDCLGGKERLYNLTYSLATYPNVSGQPGSQVTPTLCNAYQNPNTNPYAEKEKRYVPIDFLYGEVLDGEENAEGTYSIDPDIFEGNYYEETGRCRIQDDIQMFLNGYFTDQDNAGLPGSYNYNGHYVNNYLFEFLGGDTNNPINTLPICNYVDTNTLAININVLGGACGSAANAINLDLPGNLPTSLNWNNYTTDWQIVSLKNIYYDEANSNPAAYMSKFKILAVVEVNGVQTEYVLDGETQNIDLNDCNKGCDICSPEYTVEIVESFVNIFNDLGSNFYSSNTSIINNTYNLGDDYQASVFNAVSVNEFTITNTNGVLTFTLDNGITNSNPTEFLDLRFVADAPNNAHDIILVTRQNGQIIENHGTLTYSGLPKLDVCFNDPRFRILVSFIRQKLDDDGDGLNEWDYFDYVAPLEFDLNEDINVEISADINEVLDFDNLIPMGAGNSLQVKLLKDRQTYEYGLNSGLQLFKDSHGSNTNLYKGEASFISPSFYFPITANISQFETNFNGSTSVFEFQDVENGDAPVNTVPNSPIEWRTGFNNQVNPLEAYQYTTIDGTQYLQVASGRDPQNTNKTHFIFQQRGLLDFEIPNTDFSIKTNFQLAEYPDFVDYETDQYYNNKFFGALAVFSNLAPLAPSGQNYPSSNVVIGLVSQTHFTTNEEDECPCIVQTVAPVSCDEKWTTFEQDMITSPIVTDFTIPEYLTKEHFCNMNFGYITDAYISYLNSNGVNTVEHPRFLTIAEFGNTEVNYGFEGIDALIAAYAALPLPTDLEVEEDLHWRDFVSNYVAANNDVCLPKPMVPQVNLIIEGIDVEEFAFPCDTWSTNLQQAYANANTQDYINNLRGDFEAAYAQNAVGQVVEHFDMSFTQAEYQYTLYYYDQSGNLIQTVPPQGVVRMSSDVNEAIDQARMNNTEDSSLIPAHTLATKYKYNSLNQLVWQKTPDGGITRFAYDKLGRIIASQNAKQALVSTINNVTNQEAFSYTFYDELGRITEAGQMHLDAAYDIDDNGRLIGPGINGLSNDNELVVASNHATSSGVRTEVSLTRYDDLQDIYIPYFENYVDNNRGRVTTIKYFKELPALGVSLANIPDYANAIFYNYDIHGNVNEIVREINDDDFLKDNGQSIKRTKYEYDLISGNVNKVIYQNGQIDQFIHKYQYDADNRIVNVQTSRDGVIWEQDANYNYYDHGPLARTQLGEHKVQGLDYAYTLQGWLKAVNSDRLSPDIDMGKDGFAGNVVAKDAFGYTLHYYAEDYTARQGTNTFMQVANASPYNLYNGNIKTMTTSLLNHKNVLLNTTNNNYRYDQLNRIKNMNAQEMDENGLITQGITTNYGFDRNGNLDHLFREARHSNGNIEVMDNLSYTYIDGKNQLDHVTDEVDENLFDIDVDTQVAGNYSYDEIGQLLKDQAEGISNIEWTVSGKVAKITKSNPASEISFAYDPLGNRLSKTFVDFSARNAPIKTTYYIRDAQGNVLSVYKKSDNQLIKPTLNLEEQNIYGSARVGLQQLGIDMVSPEREKEKTTTEKALQFNASTEAIITNVDAFGFKNKESINLAAILKIEAPVQNGWYHIAKFEDEDDNNTNTLYQISLDVWYQGGMYQPALTLRTMIDNVHVKEVVFALEQGVKQNDLDINFDVQIIDEASGKYDVVLQLNEKSYIVDKGLTQDISTSAYTQTHTTPENKIADNTQNSLHFDLSYFSYAINNFKNVYNIDEGMGNPLSADGQEVLQVLPMAQWRTYGIVVRDHERIIGDKRYELSNHLGNVLSVITDHKALSKDAGIITNNRTFDDNTSILPWQADALTANMEIEKNRLRVDSKVNLNGVKALYTLEGGKTYQFNFTIDRDLFNYNLEFGVSHNDKKVLNEFIKKSGKQSFTIKTQETGDYILYLGLRESKQEFEKEQTFYIDNFEIVDKTQANNTISDYTFIPEVVSYNDYYPYGQLIPTRNYSSPEYRYGFQGQEKDDEVKGSGNSVNYRFRMHDPRIGRFFAPDPLEPKYPWYTPYQFSGNKVIHAIELEGLEEHIISRSPGELTADALNAAIDGYQNYVFIVNSWLLTDEREGYFIYRILTSKYYEAELERQGIYEYDLLKIPYEDFGRTLNVRKRNRYFVIEPEKGVLSDLFDLTVSVIDIAAVTPVKGGGAFMAVRSFSGASSLSTVLRSLKINKRTKEILDLFTDSSGSGKFSKIEAEGAAILEDAFDTTMRAVKKYDKKSGDFIFIGGKYANKSVDMISAVKHFKFDINKYIKSIDNHFKLKGKTTDFFNIDIRALDDAGKKLVKQHVSKMSKADQAKVIYTE